MPIPSVTLTPVDPGLPKSAPGTVTALVAGVSSAGTANVVQSFGSEKAVVDAFASGPLVEALLDCLRSGGAPVLGCKLAGAVAAANSVVVSVGTAPPVVTIAGTAVDYLDLRIEITTAGAAGRFRYSLDGGTTFSQTRAITASFLMPGTGITISFPVGSYAADNVYTATCQEAYVDGTNITSLQTAVLASPREWDVLYIAGRGRTASGAATLVGNIGSMLDALNTAKRYKSQFAVLSAGTDAQATTATAGASTVDSRVIVGFGFRYAPSFAALEGRSYRNKDAAQDVVARISANLISTDLSRTNSPLSGTLSDSAGAPRISHDEYVLQNMDDLGYATLRTWPGKQGVFFTNARIKSPFGSDFTYSQRRLVFNRARAIAYSALVDWIGKNVRTNPDNTPNPGDQGTIAEIDAVSVEAYVNDRLADALLRERNADGFAGHCTAVLFSVDRSYNTLASDGIQGTVQIQPFATIKNISGTIGFVRSIGA